MNNNSNIIFVDANTHESIETDNCDSIVFDQNLFNNNTRCIQGIFVCVYVVRRHNIASMQRAKRTEIERHVEIA